MLIRPNTQQQKTAKICFCFLLLNFQSAIYLLLYCAIVRRFFSLFRMNGVFFFVFYSCCQRRCCYGCFCRHRYCNTTNKSSLLSLSVKEIGHECQESFCFFLFVFDTVLFSSFRVLMLNWCSMCVCVFYILFFFGRHVLFMCK